MLSWNSPHTEYMDRWITKVKPWLLYLHMETSRMENEKWKWKTGSLWKKVNVRNLTSKHTESTSDAVWHDIEQIESISKRKNVNATAQFPATPTVKILFFFVFFCIIPSCSSFCINIYIVRFENKSSLPQRNLYYCIFCFSFDLSMLFKITVVVGLWCWDDLKIEYDCL